MKKWSPDYHLFQIANSIKGLFAREPLRPAAHLLKEGVKPAVVPDTAFAIYQRQRAQLQDVLQQKEDEIARLKASLSGKTKVDRGSQREKYLERRQLELEEELFDIEEKFHWADISAVPFAKEYFRVRTQLQLIALMSK